MAISIVMTGKWMEPWLMLAYGGKCLAEVYLILYYLQMQLANKQLLQPSMKRLKSGKHSACYLRIYGANNEKEEMWLV